MSTAADLRHNVTAESIFSAFNGVFMALAILAAPIVAVTAFQASALQLTVLVAAFPVGVFFGPLWAGLGRRLGMQRLVTQMAVWANLPLLALFWVESGWAFTLVVSVSQVLNSAMRMGQSSLYHVLYPRDLRGRVLGRLTFCTYATMVPSILATGWLLDMSHETYRLLYPLAGLCGLIGCAFYATLRVPASAAALDEGENLGWRERLAGVERILAGDRGYLLFQAAYFLSGSAVFMSTHIVLLLVKDRFPFNAFELALWLSVVPQLALAVSSPAWGPVLDRLGVVRMRLLTSTVMTTYLLCYLVGILAGWPVLIIVGSILSGVSNGGGQLTWALGSTYFAPRPEEVPLYTAIHFWLNGVRGLLLPWVGSALWVLTGAGAVFAAAVVSAAALPLVVRALRYDPGRHPRTVAGPPAELVDQLPAPTPDGSIVEAVR